jgi:hypothetical protein
MHKFSELPTHYTGKGRVLRIKEGFNPNSSSLGSIVFSIPAAIIATPVILAGAAAWIASSLAQENSTEKSDLSHKEKK